MYYSTVELAKAHQDELLRVARRAQGIPDRIQKPGYWDMILLRLGDRLIQFGYKIREESAYANLTECRPLNTHASGGRA